MSEFHHQRLPETSAFLAGRGPVEPGLGVLTERVQIYYRRDDDLSVDALPHCHTGCDEFFIVMAGSIVFDVEGKEHAVGAGEFCHFPVGLFHKIKSVAAPLEALVIRAPSVEDKVYGTA